MKALATLTVSATLLALALSAAAQNSQSAKATLKNAEGKEVGTASLTETPAGLLIRLSVNGLPPGERSISTASANASRPSPAPARTSIPAARSTG